MLLLCTQHHALYDMGIIRFYFWDGGDPRFLDRMGEEFPPNAAMLRYRERSPPDHVGEPPPTGCGLPVDRTTSLVHC